MISESEYESSRRFFLSRGLPAGRLVITVPVIGPETAVALVQLPWPANLPVPVPLEFRGILRGT